MLSVEPLKAYDDNYIWLVSTNEGSIVVDPGESNKIINLIDKNMINLRGVLITHHHFDHTNGLNDLLDKKKLNIFGPKNNIDGINKIVSHSDKFNLIGIDFEVIEIPGHTIDHIGFYSFNNGNPILFCGDTLFAGGCGRVFEGTYEQMHQALNKLSKLPRNTKIYCGHEYTNNNGNFCLSIDKENSKLKKRTKEVKNKINKNLPTLPVLLSEELETNIFLRCDNSKIKNILNMNNASKLEVFTKLRNLKDQF